MRRVTRRELAEQIERWGVFRCCVRKRRRIQLQIWTPDRDFSRRVCAQYARKFYTEKVTRDYLRPHEFVYPVTFSQRGTSSVLAWARDKFECERHREIADAVLAASLAAERIRTTIVRIRKGETKYLHLRRRFDEFPPLFRAAMDRVRDFWAFCPLSEYGKWDRIRHPERYAP